MRKDIFKLLKKKYGYFPEPIQFFALLARLVQIAKYPPGCCNHFLLWNQGSSLPRCQSTKEEPLHNRMRRKNPSSQLFSPKTMGDRPDRWRVTGESHATWNDYASDCRKEFSMTTCYTREFVHLNV